MSKRLALTLVLAISACSGSDTREWPVLDTGLFKATLTTRWRDNRFYYQITVQEDTLSPLQPDSVPSKVLLRLYDSGGFEGINLELPVSASGAYGQAYANDSVECPIAASGGQGRKCDEYGLRSAKRWVLLPYDYIPDPAAAGRIRTVKDSIRKP